MVGSVGKTSLAGEGQSRGQQSDRVVNAMGDGGADFAA